MAGVVLLQRRAKVMPARRWEIVGDAFVEVSFSVAVCVVKTSNLVRSEDQNISILNHNPQSLIESRRNALPAKRLCGHVINAVHDPYFAHQGRHDDSPIVQTSHAANSHCRLERIDGGLRKGDAVDRDPTGFITQNSLSFREPRCPLSCTAREKIGNRRSDRIWQPRGRFYLFRRAVRNLQLNGL